MVGVEREPVMHGIERGTFREREDEVKRDSLMRWSDCEDDWIARLPRVFAPFAHGLSLSPGFRLGPPKARQAGSIQ
ncbi:hypothetical protein IE53DRAFT_384164 [Violaceomyces palustris]|uniref:Uncharacterized protein n=1 Tax=Violaceomyces palustris TaxID=1673888 RepID=A0ACD0P5P6_9BASI|nr:hypothetical protein IE53DRAFT_384164 [Violaceomyces palustris]